MGAVHSIVVAMESMGECITCGVPIYGPAQFKRLKLENHTSFYCVNGHSQSYTSYTALEKAERERDSAKRDAEFQRNQRLAAERQLSAAKGEITKAKNRAAAGLCPCCKRSFANLRRHMASKHPEQGGGRDA